MSILTLGLWLVSWAAISIGIRLWPWVCTQCGWRLSRISLDRERKTASQAGEETE